MAKESLQQRNQLAGEVAVMHGRLQSLTADNQKMEVEVQALRQSLQVRLEHPPPPSTYPTTSMGNDFGGI